MKICLRAPKNIREMTTFFGAGNDVQIKKREMPYLSGLPPSGRGEKQPKGAVNMAEFPQLDGVRL